MSKDDHGLGYSDNQKSLQTAENFLQKEKCSRADLCCKCATSTATATHTVFKIRKLLSIGPLHRNFVLLSSSSSLSSSCSFFSRGHNLLSTAAMPLKLCRKTYKNSELYPFIEEKKLLSKITIVLLYYDKRTSSPTFEPYSAQMRGDVHFCLRPSIQCKMPSFESLVVPDDMMKSIRDFLAYRPPTIVECKDIPVKIRSSTKSYYGHEKHR